MRPCLIRRRQRRVDPPPDVGKHEPAPLLGCGARRPGAQHGAVGERRGGEGCAAGRLGLGADGGGGGGGVRLRRPRQRPPVSVNSLLTLRIRETPGITVIASRN